jgi:lysophospholipase L1-like esterase
MRWQKVLSFLLLCRARRRRQLDKKARMKSLLSLVMAVATLVFAPDARADADSATHYYIALGDSLAQGYQPIGGPWSPLGFPGYNQGYPDQLLKLVRDRNEHLRLVKLACGGETTTTMIIGSPWCGAGFAAGSQLAEARAFLHAHREEVVFVTLDIGGNDVTSPGGGGLAAIQANLPTILAQLRDAAGPDVPIVGMNYYHPFLPDVWFGTHDAAALQGAVDAISALNDLLTSLYGASGNPVADVESAFSTTDVGDADGDAVPDNVEQVCAWTWRCAPPPHGPDIHPNNAGYGVIARAFEEALGP